MKNKMIFFALHVKDYLLSSLFLPQFFSSQMDARHSAKKQNRSPQICTYICVADSSSFLIYARGTSLPTYFDDA